MQIVSVNLSRDKGTAKQPVAEAVIGLLGLTGDAHAGDWTRQVSLLGADAVDADGGAADRRARVVDDATGDPELGLRRCRTIF